MVEKTFGDCIWFPHGEIDYWLVEIPTPIPRTGPLLFQDNVLARQLIIFMLFMWKIMNIHIVTQCPSYVHINLKWCDNFMTIQTFRVTLTGKISLSPEPLTPYFLVLLRMHPQLLWHSQGVHGLFQPRGSREAGCHHTSGLGPGFHVLDSILPMPQPHSRALLQADQLRVPPVSQWLCILET